jgi:hypothetical protein
MDTQTGGRQTDNDRRTLDRMLSVASVASLTLLMNGYVLAVTGAGEWLVMLSAVCGGVSLATTVGACIAARIL